VVFVFLALSVAFEGSYAISGALIVSTYLLLFFADIRARIALTKAEKGLIIVLLCYLASAVLEVLVYDVPLRKLDPQSKILLFIPLIYVLSAINVYPLVVMSGIAIGCLGLFCLALFEKYYLGYDRVGSYINPIQLGNIAMIFGILSMLCAPIYYMSYKKWPIPVLLLLAGVLSFVASFSTLTRGGLIFLPLLLIVIALYYRHELKRHAVKLIVLSCIVIPVCGLSVANTESFSRFQLAAENVENYFSQGDAKTSTGIRLELWKVAAIITKNNPLFGVGYSGHLAEKRRLIENGDINEAVLKYKHSHNAYFDISARRGLVGLIILLVLLFYPIYVGHQKYKQGGEQTKGIAISLVVFGLFFVLANLTQVLFSHNSGMIIYTGLLIIIIAYISAVEQRCESTSDNS